MKKLSLLIAVGVIASCTQQLPTCPAGQFVTSDGSKLSCSAPTTVSVPSCAAGLVLTAQNGMLTCASVSGTGGTTVPTCATGQVLTANGTTFSCTTVPSGTTPPACDAGTVLTSSASGFSCVDLPAAPPSCGSGQVLTSNGTSLSCTTVSSGVTPPPSCDAGTALANTTAGYACVALPASPPTCGAGFVLSNTANGLTCVALPTPTAVPSCDAGTLLSATGAVLGCVEPPRPLTPAPCAAGQALSFGTAGFTCIDVLPSYPLCAVDAFLKATDAGLVCANVNVPTPAPPRYVGVTDTPMTGQITRSGSATGLIAANGLCADKFGAGTRMCLMHDMINSLGTSIQPTTTIPRAWVINTTTVDTGTLAPGNNLKGWSNNCLGFTYRTGDHAWYGTTVEWAPSLYGGNAFTFQFGTNSACNVSMPIACCK